MQAALALIDAMDPDLEVEGEMHGDAALSEAIRSAYGLDQVHSVPNVEPWIELRERPAASPLADLAKYDLFSTDVRFLTEDLPRHWQPARLNPREDGTP